MDQTLLFAVILFAFVMSVTPGPNNMMLLASGAQFGYLRTLPHIFGIIIGIACLLGSVLIGLGVVFELYPVLYDLLKAAGSIYLLWLAWKISTAPTDENALNPKQKSAHAGPMNLLSASLFQFVNPKAWAMAIGSISSFAVAGEHYLESGLWIMGSFAVTGFIAISLWTCLGVAIRSLLTTESRKRYFNRIMGAMTAATILLILSS
ncbi:LysE family translocator [Psychromonas ossibalaenae]|uniref:LysE family translocator n=1 Tax=Psychromonas ossibalaenae TaxID=444922 RepID=UPI000373FCEE|nr:LysE family translocator [Psychromonas ossibalaenae]